MRNYVRFLVFAKYSSFTSTQLRIIHRNLRHPSVEKQMRITEQADLEDLPESTRNYLHEFVKYGIPHQLNQGKPKRFLLSVRDPIIGEFNHALQIDKVLLKHGNVLHLIDFRTSFRNEGFINKLEAISM